MLKKTWILLMVFALVMASVVGCSNENNGMNNENNDPATGLTKVSDQTPPRKVELKVFMSFPRFKEQFEAYFEAFKAKELAEKNIDVTIELEMPSSEQAGQILQARLASNDAPDIFTLHALADIPTFAKAGYLSDLSNLDFVDTVYDSVKDTVTYEGKVLALPLESLAWGYLYNKDIFDAHGLTPPQTLSEMDAVIQTLNDNDVTPFLLSFQESWIPQLMMALSLGGTVTGEQPDFIENMNAGKGSYSDVASVFNIIDRIMENGTEKPFEVGSAAGSADFANGKAAMWIQGPWMSESILKVNPEMRLGVAPLPVSEKADSAMINLSTSTSLAISPTSKNKDVAEDLLNFILDEEKSSDLFKALNFNPIASMHTYELFPWVNEAMAYVAEGKAYQDLSLPGGVTDETAQLLQSYYAGTVTKEEMIKSLDKAWAAALKAQ